MGILVTASAGAAGMKHTHDGELSGWVAEPWGRSHRLLPEAAGRAFMGRAVTRAIVQSVAEVARALSQ